MLQSLHPEGDPGPDENGFLVVRLKAGAIKNRKGDLGEAAREANLGELDRCMGSFKLSGKRLITSIEPGKLEQLEQVPYEDDPAPKQSLSAYWRLDARQLTAPLDEVETALRSLPEVELVYREKTATDPVTPDDTHAELEGFLNPATAGVDARWAWTQPNGDGAGMHVIDLEQGWLRGHEDLPPYTLVYGDNRDGAGTYVGNHGAAVLGIVAGVDNDKGIIGLAPQASVRVASHWSAAAGPEHVADALMAAVTATPRPHVVLIEVQIGANPRLPAEADPATLAAIRCAVAHGIIVVEAAGNSHFNLDTWVDAEGKRRLDRESEDFVDSGAIMAGAGLSTPPHNRHFWSNYGSRVDCYAWGDSIVTAGYGDLGGSGSTSYTRSFDQTSGASAIIAGCTVLLQGLYRASTEDLLRPRKMRALLSNPSTGTPQGPDRAGHIGVMPNLRKIVERVLKVDQRGAA